MSENELTYFERENLSWDLEVKSRARVVELYEALGLLTKHGGDRKSKSTEPRVHLIAKSRVAGKMGITHQALNRDIQLAHELEKNPSLARLPSKKKTLRFIRQSNTKERLLAEMEDATVPSS